MCFLLMRTSTVQPNDKINDNNVGKDRHLRIALQDAGMRAGYVL